LEVLVQRGGAAGVLGRGIAFADVSQALEEDLEEAPRALQVLRVGGDLVEDGVDPAALSAARPRSGRAARQLHRRLRVPRAHRPGRGYPHYAAGWHSISTIGPIAAAAATARLLRLSPEQSAHALALAASTAAGLKAQFGSDAKAIHAGLAARAGLEAALLAEAGIAARPDLMEVRYGFLDCYGAPGSPGREGRYELPGAADRLAILSHPILRKPWPSCSYTHRPIGAALALARQVRAADIRSGVISLPEPYARVAPFLQPNLEAEARFSVPWCVAAALLDGEVSPESFRGPALQRADLRALVDRLALDAYATGPDLEDQSLIHVDSVSLVLQDGRKLSETVAKVKGGPHDPMTLAEIVDKFRLCGGTAEAAQQILHGCRAQASPSW
jgi:2-methylcitrate dehydratase PrpD